MKRFLLIVLLAIGLSACASSTPPANAVDSASCADVTLAGNPPRPTSAKLAGQSASCFVQAFRACAPKKLTIHQPDTGAVREFNIVPGPSCSLQESWQQDKNSPVVTANCKSVRAENGTLLVEGCSQLGDFSLNP